MPKSIEIIAFLKSLSVVMAIIPSLTKRRFLQYFHAINYANHLIARITSK